MKIANFVWGIIFFALSVLMSVLCYNVYGSIQETNGGIAALSLIVTIPLLLMLYVVLLSFLVGAVFNTVRSIFIDVKAIKIISIILVVLEVCVTVFDVFIALKFLG